MRAQRWKEAGGGVAAGKEVRVEYQNICFSAALAGPGVAPLRWEGGPAGCSASERFMPCTPSVHRRLSTAQF